MQARLCHIEVANIALFGAAYRCVNSEADCLVAGLLGALDENLGYLIVLMVELEPEGPCRHLRYLFDAVA